MNFCLLTVVLTHKFLAARLQRNIPTQHVAHDVFDSMNRTAQDAGREHWTMEPWQHFVALDEEYTKQVDLPHAQRWPWMTPKAHIY